MAIFHNHAIIGMPGKVAEHGTASQRKEERTSTKRLKSLMSHAFFCLRARRMCMHVSFNGKAPGTVSVAHRLAPPALRSMKKARSVLRRASEMMSTGAVACSSTRSRRH